jgi:chromosome segregation ATPase
VGAGLSGGGLAAKADAATPAPASGTPVAHRHESRMLRARVLMLQRQLQQAHARCRRAEQVNAEWRRQHSALRARERESWAAMQQALRKAERLSEMQGSNGKLRDALSKRNAELVRCGQRIAELELMCENLRDALGQAMGQLRPETLDALC